MLAAIAVSVAAGGIVLYVMLQPKQAAAPLPAAVSVPAAPSPPAAANDPNARPLDRMAERLAARLAKDGGSAADWALLGRSYREMGRWPDAVQAFEKSLALAPDAQVRADLDNARAKAAGK